MADEDLLIGEATTVVGAGLSGAVIARVLAEHGCKVTVFEQRPHIAGNCYTERDPETGILVHRYGPHIFHTDNEAVWAFANRFAKFRDFRHTVYATAKKRIYSLPITLATINQFFGTTMRPDEARTFVEQLADKSISEPQSFEEQAQHMVGNELYETFFEHYTKKQWGRSPTTLPASILKRLPLRFNYESSYFNHKYQAMPESGYTPWIGAMLDHENITVLLETAYAADHPQANGHVFWSGPLDGYFDYNLGRLAYRTLRFEDFVESGDYQGCPVMNYCDAEPSFTRITEHKHFTPWEDHEKTICSVEYPKECTPEDTPYYPVRLVDDKELLASYIEQANELNGVTFVGRLGTYRYLDMDVCIAEALETAQAFVRHALTETQFPSFIKSPL